jgi:hypothetical protein
MNIPVLLPTEGDEAAEFAKITAEIEAEKKGEAVLDAAVKKTGVRVPFAELRRLAAFYALF